MAGCSLDTGKVLYVAPSAEPHIEAIIEAVEGLNAHLGTEEYSVCIASSEERVDEQIIVRGRESLTIDGRRAVAATKRTTRGVIMLVTAGAAPASIAHEIGHAMGLHHVDDHENLMFKAATSWKLTEEQVATLLSVGY